MMFSLEGVMQHFVGGYIRRISQSMAGFGKPVRLLSKVKQLRH